MGAQIIRMGARSPTRGRYLQAAGPLLTLIAHFSPVFLWMPSFTLLKWPVPSVSFSS